MAMHGQWKMLESVSSCTRFSGFLAISSFSFNRLSSKLVGMLVGIVTMFTPKDFVPDCFRRADMRIFLRERTFWRIYARRSNPELNPLVRTLELFQKTCLPNLSSNG